MKCGYHLCGKEAKKKFCSKRCMNRNSVNDRRRRLKVASVIYKGGKCQICGYDKCFSALEFHHRDPKTKDFSIASLTTCSWEKLKKEIDKCDLVCGNCHQEIESKDYDFKYHLIKDTLDFSKGMSNEKLAESLVCRQEHEVNTCSICSRHITKDAKLCKYCYLEINTPERPTKEWLQQLVYMVPFLEIAKIYQVTDNTIRKWCKIFGVEIPKFPSGYWIKK